MPKVMFELECSQEQLNAMMAILGGSLTVKLPTVTVPSLEPAPVQAEEAPKPAKEKKAKKKDEPKAEEANPAKAEEANPAKAEEAPAEAKHSLDDIRKLILATIERIGTGDALALVEKTTGVRKAASIDPAKYGELVIVLNKAIAEHDAVG